MKRKLLIEEMKKEKSIKQQQQNELNEFIDVNIFTKPTVEQKEEVKLETIIEENKLESTLTEKQLIKKYIDDVDKQIYKNKKNSWYNYFWSFIY